MSSILTDNPWSIYEALIAECGRIQGNLCDITLGINWSAAEFDFDGFECQQPGICFSPNNVRRTLPWGGNLLGRSLSELSQWVKNWEPAAAVVGMLAINAAINSSSNLIGKATNISMIYPEIPSNLSVFRYFEDQLIDQRVTVIGSYPDINQIQGSENWHCIERQPKLNELPDPAAKYVLYDSGWVFITGASLPNKTLPLLLEYSKNATVVLMGPSVPWSTCWSEFGVDYIAGVEVYSKAGLYEVARQAGGTQLFDKACHYKILKL